MSSSEQVLAKKNSKIANDLWAKYEINAADSTSDQSKIEKEEKEKESPSIIPNEQCKSLTLKMNDGNTIPQIGLGTYLHARVKAYFDRDKNTKISANDLSGDKEAQRKVFESSIKSFIKDRDENEKQEKEFKTAVITAIKAGYRHIDTAQIYRTESVIGNALKELISDGLINRSEVFITSKIAKDIRTPQDIKDSIDRSLAFLNVSYLDMMLIHSPHSLNEIGQRGQDVIEMYKILHDYKSQGKIKSVGVSNFGIEQLKILNKGCPNLPLPTVNQIECHPFCQELELIKYCLDSSILIESYCPLAQCKEFVTTNAVINEIATKYKVTFAHILLRWQLQKGFVLLPKSVTPQRIIANADLFGFELMTEEMAKLDLLGNAKQRLLWNPMRDVVWDDIYKKDDVVEFDKFDPEDPDVQSEGLNCINSLNEDDLNKVKNALKRDIALPNCGNVNKQLLIFLNGIIGTNHSDEECEDEKKTVPESPNTRKVLEQMFEEKEKEKDDKNELVETRNALQINYKNRQSPQTLKEQNILVNDEDTLSVQKKELQKNQKKDILNREMRKRSESDTNKLSENDIQQKIDLKQTNDDKLSEFEDQKETIYKLREVILRKESQLQQFIDLSNEQKALMNDEAESESASDVDIKRCLLILNKLNSEIVAFKVHFSEANVQQIGGSNVNELVDANSSFNAKLDKYEQVIDGIDARCRDFRECVRGIKAFVKNKFIPKSEEYERWNLEQMLLWIRCLESGRFVQYLEKLRVGFVESDIVNGSELPDLSTADLSVTPFNIKVFRDKRDLIKHFKSLRNGLNGLSATKQNETKRRDSQRMFGTNLIGTASKDTNDIAHEIFLENSQQYVD